jgi:hypothetical protein
MYTSSFDNKQRYIFISGFFTILSLNVGYFLKQH